MATALPPTIDLAVFADRVNTARDDGCPMTIASVGHDGQPDVSLRGSVMVWDADHLAFWERSFLETHDALQQNAGKAKVCAFYFCPTKKERQLRFYGEARAVTDPALRERIWERVVESEKHGDPERKGVAYLIRVDRVRQAREVVQQRA